MVCLCEDLPPPHHSQVRPEAHLRPDGSSAGMLVSKKPGKDHRDSTFTAQELFPGDR